MNDSLSLDGYTLRPKDVAGHVWTYVPLQPNLELGANGAPQFQILEAGTLAFLQCTARLALDDVAIARLLQRLKELQPDAEALEMAPLSVDRLALEVKIAEAWLSIAESKGSGASPWHAALAATLSPAPLAAIRAALSGERGHARLHASVTLAGAPATLQHSLDTLDARIQARFEEKSATLSASFSSNEDTSQAAISPTAIELDSDLSELFSKSATHD